MCLLDPDTDPIHPQFLSAPSGLATISPSLFLHFDRPDPAGEGGRPSSGMHRVRDRRWSRIRVRQSKENLAGTGDGGQPHPATAIGTVCSSLLVSTSRGFPTLSRKPTSRAGWLCRGTRWRTRTGRGRCGGGIARGWLDSCRSPTPGWSVLTSPAGRTRISGQNARNRKNPKVGDPWAPKDSSACPCGGGVGVIK